MTELKAGHYVLYKMKQYIVTETLGKMARILSPIYGKVFVGQNKLVATNHKPAVIVHYGGTNYIVTTHFNIISMDTNKVMKWGNGNGLRKDILVLAEKKKVATA